MANRPAGRRVTRAGRRILRHSAVLLVVALVAGCMGTAAPDTPGVPAPVGSAPDDPGLVVGGTAAPGLAPEAPGAPSARPGIGGGPIPPPSPAITWPLPARSWQRPPVPAAALHAQLDRLQAGAGIPGVSVAVRWADGRVWLGASGFADIDAATPMTHRTAFGLASISKTFTAAVVLQLVEERRLSLADPIIRWLPDPGIDLDGRITVRMLIDHTSGLPDFFLNPKIDRALLKQPGATWTASDALRYVSDARAVPGRAFRYSNTNYLLLGLLVERVTGRSLDREIRQRLLDPLGLVSTWSQGPETPLVDGSRAYRVRGGADGPRFTPVADRGGVMPFASVVSAAGGAGSLAGTASDAARWMEALVAGSVLRPETRDAMIAHAARTQRLARGYPYGLGVQVVQVEGHTAIGHSGRYLGTRSVVRHFPGTGITIAVLSNQSAADPAPILANLYRLLQPPRPVCRGCPAER
jgi:D-alanyl-D-alanine carboxypeptidase